MVFFSIQSNVLFTAAYLYRVRSMYCRNWMSIFVIPEEPWMTVDRIALHYTTNLGKVPIDICIRRRRKPLYYKNKIQRICLSIKPFLKASGFLERVNSLLGCKYTITKSIGIGSGDIADGMEMVRLIFDSSMNFVIKREPTYITTYDYNYIRHKINRIHPGEKPVVFTSLLFDMRFAIIYPLRYIKAIIKCFVPNINEPIPNRYWDNLDPSPKFPLVERILYNYFNPA